MRLEHWVYAIPLRLRCLFPWAQADQELDEKLRDHLPLELNPCRRADLESSGKNGRELVSSGDGSRNPLAGNFE
jgi:hypothetical protein